MPILVERTDLSPTLGEDARRALFTEARTAYQFADLPVSDEKLQEIWESARRAPTSANTQPLRVLYVQSPDARELLVKHTLGNNQDRVANAPAVAILAMDSNFHQRIPHVIPPMAALAEKLEGDVSLRNKMGTFSSALQAGYFILAVRASGLAAGPIGGFDAEGIDKEFFADTGWKSQLIVNIGYPTEGSFRPRNPRLDTDEVVRFA